MKKGIIALALVAAVTGCAGARSTNNVFATHAESFRIIGVAIPGDDQKAAYALVPKGANIETVSSTPADWNSFWGFLGNLFWFHQTTITGTLPGGK